MFKITIGVHGIQGILEGGEILAVRVVQVMEDWACPTPGCAGEIGNDEKDFLLVLGIGDRTHAEREEALGNESAVLRKFPIKLSRLVDLRLTAGFRGRGDGIGTLEGCDEFLSLLQCLFDACELD